MPENFATRSEVKQEIKGVSEVITPEADISIFYNVHKDPIPAERIRATKPHAIFLEGIGDYINTSFLGAEGETSESILSKIKNFICEKYYEQQKCYSEIMGEASTERIPIFLVDVATPKSLYNEKIISNNVGLGLPAIELVCGPGLMTLSGLEVAKLIKNNPKMDRRQFLKGFFSAGTKLIGGAYLASATAYYYAPKSQLKMSPENLPPEIFNFFNQKIKNIKSIHPEIRDSFVIDGRNALMALKFKKVAEIYGKELGAKPRVAFCIGSQHYGIEQSLMENDEAKMEKLYKFLGTSLANEKFAVRIDFLPPTEAGDLVFKASLIELPIFETFVNKKSHSTSSAE